jgi:hypothetical protein
MGLSITVDISKAAENAPAEVLRRARALQGKRLNTQIARGVQQLFQKHFFALDSSRANGLGGQRTHFYADAAKATSSEGTESEAIITVAQQGIRQRRFGGTIKARPGSWLTIPARAEAYGRRAREFHDLHFVKLKNGNAMLIAGGATGLTGKFNKKGEAIERGGSEEGVVMYWLVPSITQDADPSVLPTETEVRDIVRGVINAAWQRKDGPP